MHAPTSAERWNLGRQDQPVLMIVREIVHRRMNLWTSYHISCRISPQTRLGDNLHLTDRCHFQELTQNALHKNNFYEELFADVRK